MTVIKKLKNWARLLKQDVLMLWFATKSPNTPWAPKAICIFIVAYALSPIDLIPDFIPILGFVDDLLLLPFLIWVAIRLIPNVIVQDSRMRADQWLIQNQSKPMSNLGLLIVAVIWLLMIWLAYLLIKSQTSWYSSRFRLRPPSETEKPLPSRWGFCFCGLVTGCF